MTTRASRPGDVSAAKIGVYGTIATTLIGAAVTIIVQVIKPDTVPIAKESPLTTTIAAAPTAQTGSKPPLSQESPDGSWDLLQYHGNDSVTVGGLAEEYVQLVFIAIGPNSSHKYWQSHVDVVNQQWQADIPTGESSKNYPITVSYWPSRGGAPGAPPAAPVLQTAPSSAPVVAPAGRLVSETTSQSALKLIFEATDPTPPPQPPSPDQIADCVVESGPSCFTGPGFGPPSVYQPKQ